MSVWTERRARALRLVEEVPHAEEMLRCYAAVTEAQAAVVERVPVDRWLARARPPAGDGPSLRLESLPLDELLPLFDDFLEGMTDVGTAVMTAEAARLRGAEAGERRAALAAACGPVGAQPSFHAQAFAAAVATVLANAVSQGPAASAHRGTSRCPMCGDLPVVATLRDLPDALGSRALVCGLCGTEWRINRLTCAHCGETGADRLRVHSAESVPHVRVDECLSCNRYIKTVDLRRRGNAVPVVDDLATVELDLWARERGLARVQENLFAL